VPGLYSLVVSSVEPVVVDNEHNEPEQVLLLNLSAATGERDVAGAINAWVLPKIRPADGATRAAGSDEEPYNWNNAQEVTGTVLARADKLPLAPVPAEREYVESHSFRYHADVGRYLLVQIDKNLRSFGGYLSPTTARFIVRVPDYPPQLKILSQGSLLALSGDKKVVALVRDLPGLRIDIGRVLPDQLQHLVSQSNGDFSNPEWSGSFGPDNLIERFEQKVPLETLAHGETHYEPIDLGKYLKSGGEKRGLFLLTVQGYDPKVEARRRRAAARAAAAARQPNAATSTLDPPDADSDDTPETQGDAPAHRKTSGARDRPRHPGQEVHRRQPGCLRAIHRNGTACRVRNGRDRREERHQPAVSDDGRLGPRTFLTARRTDPRAHASLDSGHQDWRPEFPAAESR
jgi:hypothetical protein